MTKDRIVLRELLETGADRTLSARHAMQSVYDRRHYPTPRTTVLAVEKIFCRQRIAAPR